MNINLTAPINDRSYGVVGLNLLKALSKNHKVALFPIGPVYAPKQEESLIQSCINNQQKYFGPAPSVRLWHQHDLAQHVGYGPRIGFPIFELDNFNDVERHHLSNQDFLFVCSNWAKNVIENQKIKVKTFVVPLGVDSSIFNYKGGNPSKSTIFLNVGKQEVRKGHDILVELFNAAFSPSDNVELWLSWYNPFSTPEEDLNWRGRYMLSPLGSSGKIRILPWFQTQNELANVMNQADCGIFPSRAEGWNFEVLEMMACGKHVITTDYSAHTEYCNDDNAMLVKINKTEVARDGKWFYGQGNWAHIGQEEKLQFIEFMQTVHHRKQQGKLGINEGGLETAKRYSWDNTAESVTSSINLCFSLYL